MPIIVGCDVPGCKEAARSGADGAAGWATVEFAYNEKYLICPEHARALGCRAKDRPAPIDPDILAMLHGDGLGDDDEPPLDG